MDPQELAARIVRDNANARSLAQQWSSRMLSALTSDSSALLSEIINEFHRTAEGGAAEAPGQAGENQPMDDGGSV